MLIIIFVKKSCFFSKTNSHNLRQKFYICHFFSEKIIKIIYAIFAITIKDLKIYLNNSNLLKRKNIICFKFLAQKKRLVSKQLIYYFRNIKSLFYKNVYLF